MLEGEAAGDVFRGGLPDCTGVGGDVWETGTELGRDFEGECTLEDGRANEGGKDAVGVTLAVELLLGPVIGRL